MYLVFLGNSRHRGGSSRLVPLDIEDSNRQRKRSRPAPPRRSEPADLIRFDPLHPESKYLENIGNSLAAIGDGETYEVCLTNQLTAPRLRSTRSIITRKLRRRNPAPYSAFLKFPEVSVACSSPERFLKIDRRRGGRNKTDQRHFPAWRRCAEDELLKRRSSEDEKSRSENLMIVDLLRNDLGRVCSVGSVHVPKLMHVETYATVHQFVSTVRGRLSEDRTSIDCLQSAFPGGSMTGAPKIRTMEIIDDLEGQPARRLLRAPSDIWL